jgi:hypothetical protein
LLRGFLSLLPESLFLLQLFGAKASFLILTFLSEPFQFSRFLCIRPVGIPVSDLSAISYDVLPVNPATASAGELYAEAANTVIDVAPTT